MGYSFSNDFWLLWCGNESTVKLFTDLQRMLISCVNSSTLNTGQPAPTADIASSRRTAKQLQGSLCSANHEMPYHMQTEAADSILPWTNHFCGWHQWELYCSELLDMKHHVEVNISETQCAHFILQIFIFTDEYCLLKSNSNSLMMNITLWLFSG